MCKAIEEMLEKYRAEVEKEVIEKVTKEVAEKVTKEVQREAAQKMLKDGKLPLETIAHYSGLPLEEVLQLKEA